MASIHAGGSPTDGAQGASERARALAWLAAEPSAAAHRSRESRLGGRFTWEVDAEERPGSAGAGRERPPAQERRQRPPASAPAHRRADRELPADQEPALAAHRDAMRGARVEQGLREGPASGLAPTWRSAERYEAPDLASASTRQRSPRRRLSAGHEHRARNPESHGPHPEPDVWIGYGADSALARGSGGAADPDHITVLRQQRVETYQPAERGYAEDERRSSSGGSAAGEPHQASYSPSRRVDPRASHGGGALAALLAEMHGSRSRAGSAHARANPDPASTATRPDLGPWDSAWDRTRAAAEAPKPARGTAAPAAAAGGRSKPSEFAHLFGEAGRGGDGPVAQRLDAELREAGARQGRGGRGLGGYGGTLEGYGGQGGRHGSGVGRELLRDISPLRAFRGGSGAREGPGPAPNPAARPYNEGVRGTGQEGRRAHDSRQAPRDWELRAPNAITEDAWRGVSPLSGLRLGSQARAQYS